MIAAGTLPPSLRLGAVHLTVPDLARSLDWYERSLGLHVAGRDAHSVALGDGAETLVVLHEDAAGRADDAGAGLFHYCLLYPSRAELGRALARLESTGAEITNIRDRGTHEAIYLPDPDGNTLELAWDRPRAEWPTDPYGHEPVAIEREELLAAGGDGDVRASVARGMEVGHVHVTIGDLDDAVAFYHHELGFDLMYHVGWGAFFSVGGYHHNAAANIRRGEGLPPQSDGALGLRHWTIQLSDDEAVAETRRRFEAAGRQVETLADGFAVRDPWQLELHVVSR